MPTTTYTVFDGEILSENRAGTVRDYVADPLGSTVALLDNTQAQTDTFTYWPYGEEKNRTGTTDTPFRYTGPLGHYRDSAKRAYVLARHLEVSYGSWLTIDPTSSIAGSRSDYVFVFDNPVSFVDIDGNRGRKWSPGSPFAGPCVTRVCSAYGFSDDTVIGSPIVTHQWVCAITGKGEKCIFGMGGFDKNQPCGDSNANGYAIRCKTVSTDCQFASLACYCIRKTERTAPPYQFHWNACIHTKEYVELCMNQLLPSRETMFYPGVRGRVGATTGMW